MFRSVILLLKPEPVDTPVLSLLLSSRTLFGCESPIETSSSRYSPSLLEIFLFSPNHFRDVTFFPDSDFATFPADVFFLYVDKTIYRELSFLPCTSRFKRRDSISPPSA